MSLPLTRTQVLAMMVLLMATSSGQAQDRAGPYLKLLQKSERLRRAWTLPPPALKGTSISETRLPVLILTSEPARTISAVIDEGGTANTLVGPVLSAILPLRTIESISKRPEVSRIEAAPPRKILLDISRPEVKANLVEAGTGLPFPVDGTGVIVGLVDTGIDFAHVDFSRGQGHSRVLQIWDQAFATGDPPPGQTQGHFCDGTRIRLGTCDSIDVVGHGSHVASTMASASNKYRGMAPNADLMVVASIDFSLLVDSVSWLFDEAGKLNKPMVINLSLGGHYGPHDGTDPESMALSGLTGPGKIIVAAAGNEGSDFIHLGYDPSGGTGKTIFLVYTGLDVNSALFDIWYPPSSNLSFAVGVQRADQEIAETNFFEGAGSGGTATLADGATALGTVQFEPAAGLNPGNNKVQLDIDVEPAQAAFEGNPSGYVWYLKVRGTGPFSAWSAASGFLTPPAHFSSRSDGGLIPGDNNESVGAPALAKDIIAVASYATKGSWTAFDGTLVNHPETKSGDLSFFSSHGPSADPDSTGYKPEVAAPGEYIVAALSRNTGSLEAGTKIDDTHQAMRGTSMACPHVAGIVALLLQVDPTLDPGRVRSLLTSTARADSHTGDALPDLRWGYGKVDALEAVAKALGVGKCSANEDCAEGYSCSKEKRCQKAESGCGCSTSEPTDSIDLLVSLAILAAAVLVRRRWRKTPSIILRY